MDVEIFNISICDDISSERLILKQMIDRYMRNSNIIYNIDEYNSGEEMLKGEYSKYSLIFLDIFMNDLDGIETAKLIKSVNKNANIVFCSTSNEFAAESYDVSAFYYITKPVNENRLFSVLDKFFQMYSKMQSITVKVGRDTENILITDIIYAEAQGKKRKYIQKVKL